MWEGTIFTPIVLHYRNFFFCFGLILFKLLYILKNKIHFQSTGHWYKTRSKVSGVKTKKPLLKVCWRVCFFSKFHIKNVLLRLKISMLFIYFFPKISKICWTPVQEEKWVVCSINISLIGTTNICCPIHID